MHKSTSISGQKIMAEWKFCVNEPNDIPENLIMCNIPWRELCVRRCQKSLAALSCYAIRVMSSPPRAAHSWTKFVQMRVAQTYCARNHTIAVPFRFSVSLVGFALFLLMWFTQPGFVWASCFPWHCAHPGFGWDWCLVCGRPQYSEDQDSFGLQNIVKLCHVIVQASVHSTQTSYSPVRNNIKHPTLLYYEPECYYLHRIFPHYILNVPQVLIAARIRPEHRNLRFVTSDALRAHFFIIIMIRVVIN